MKRAILALCVVCLTATAALAEWLVDFKNNYSDRGIEVAVEKALEEGVTPLSIVENGVQLQNINLQNMVKALFCGGADGTDIRDAAARYNISEQDVAAGFKKSVEECGDQVGDSQSYYGGRGFSAKGSSYASPSQFSNRRGQ